MIKLTKGMIVHCNSQEKAEIFLKECSKQGIKASSGEDVSRIGVKGINVWKQCKENTCYSIEKSMFRNELKLEFDRVEYYKTNGCRITEFDDLFKTKSKVEVGDIVEVIARGKQYTTYKNFIKINMPEKLEYYNSTGFMYYNKEYKVLHVSKHEDCDRNLCILEDLDGDEVFIIRDDGVRFVRKSNKKECEVKDRSYCHDSDVSKVIDSYPCVIVILKSGEKGIARCLPEDNFDRLKGYEIAYRKAQIKKLKNELKVLTK